MITSEIQTDLRSDAASNSASGDPRRRGIKQALFAVSLANLCFLNSWYLVLYQSAEGYFNKLREERGVVPEEPRAPPFEFVRRAGPLCRGGRVRPECRRPFGRLAASEPTTGST